MKKSVWFIITGSGIIALSTAGLKLNLWFFTHFYTPLMWSGYILLLDGVNFSVARHSLIISRTREFIWMLFFSIVFWYIFEFYNLFIQNWYYINLPENRMVRYFGYFWSFATIWPGVLETFELIHHLQLFKNLKIKSLKVSPFILYMCMLLGMIATILPFLLPPYMARYTAVLVWVGPVFLLDPILYFRKKNSLCKELERGSLTLMFQLFTAGAICGFWWEFWNYWATTKWKYSVPFGPDLYIFEMPVIGFLGFLPFAIEVFLMWEITKHILKLK
jgi:hypothetical protein